MTGQDEDRRTHWENVYSTKAADEVSWYEDTPSLSLELLQQAGMQPGHSIIDIGGGASRLVDALVAAGQGKVAVLDLSASALAASKARLPDDSDVSWIVSDITKWVPDRPYDFWHDRAALHFLTSPDDQQSYARVLSSALVKGGHAIIGTFAPDGPEKCSGLPVARHDAASLAAILGNGFSLLAERRHEHHTPWGSVQKFQFSTFQKL